MGKPHPPELRGRGTLVLLNRSYNVDCELSGDRRRLIGLSHGDVTFAMSLSQDLAGTLPRIVKVIEGSFRKHLAAGTGERPLGRRFIDDLKVTDHHAIIPTLISPEKTGMNGCAPQHRFEPGSTPRRKRKSTPPLRFTLVQSQIDPLLF
jgi:hypothetical protein